MVDDEDYIAVDMNHAEMWAEQVQAGTVVKLTGNMRAQHRDAHRIQELVPEAVVQHWDPTTGIEAYGTVRAPGTHTWVFVSQSGTTTTASMGSAIPRP